MSEFFFFSPFFFNFQRQSHVGKIILMQIAIFWEEARELIVIYCSSHIRFARVQNKPALKHGMVSLYNVTRDLKMFRYGLDHIRDCIRHCSQHWVYSDELGRRGLCPLQIYILREISAKNQIEIMANFMKKIVGVMWYWAMEWGGNKPARESISEQMAFD